MSPLNVNSAAPEATSAAGFWVIVVFGAVVSTVQLKDAGVASVLAAWSIARTSKLWAPSASAE